MQTDKRHALETAIENQLDVSNVQVTNYISTTGEEVEEILVTFLGSLTSVPEGEVVHSEDKDQDFPNKYIIHSLVGRAEDNVLKLKLLAVPIEGNEFYSYSKHEDTQSILEDH